jgi:homoserine O-succinyltransferase/O-acetyltransferase
MPVVIDRSAPDHRPDFQWSPDRISIGLVNNMPDSALEATERQFAGLLDEAALDCEVQLVLFTLPEIWRGDRAAAHVKAHYRSLDALWRMPLDALIVTGTEPRAPDLREEPYWQRLATLIDWADENTVSTIFSCLAAHAAVLRIDGIARRPLPRKLFGIFPEAIGARHPLTDGLTGLIAPHSRWNELKREDLAANGYEILTNSEEAGVGMFAKMNDSLFLFFQGHPEYEAETLLREYRRDIGRYLRGERPSYPARPQHYFDIRARDRVIGFRQRALADRDREMLGEFPIFELRRGLRHSWHPAAVAVYRNWLRFIGTHKPMRLAARILRETASVAH